VQRLEQVLTNLDHDVRDRLELVEGPAASETQRDDSLEPVPTKAH